MKMCIRAHLPFSKYNMCVFQLVLTVGLLAVVVYLYTVVAFNFFRKFYNKSEDKAGEDMKCNDMLTVSYRKWEYSHAHVLLLYILLIVLMLKGSTSTMSPQTEG